jgi:protein-S-isoprenylcysteine O-methyltransferase Ste14
MIGLAAALYALAVPGTMTVVVPWLMLREAEGLSAARAWYHHLGWLPVVSGAAIVACCVYAFVVRGHGTPAPTAPPTALVAVGPYRWTRNPMYLGILAMLAGEALAFRSPAMLAYALSAWAVMELFVRWYEEPSLARRFGPAYDAYRRRVPRWFGSRRIRSKSLSQ